MILTEALDTVRGDRTLLVRRETWPQWQAVQNNLGSPSVNDDRGFSRPYAFTTEDVEATDWLGMTTAVWLAAIDISAAEANARVGAA